MVFRYRGAVLWNFISDYFKGSCSFKQFNRKVQSVLPNLGNSYLLVHKNYESALCIVILLPFKSNSPFDAFYVFLFVG